MADKEQKTRPTAGRGRTLQKNVTADEATRRGVYSNEGMTSHNQEEFTFDFFFFAPVHPDQGQLVSRVILSPGHAKRFLMALQENVGKYERKFGEIRTPPPASNKPEIIQ